jgi:uncharacterized protein YdhG (YjbR/CyaY superfamily)
VRQPSLLAQVARYAGPKGNLQFPLSEPMPHALISQIVRAPSASARPLVSYRMPAFFLGKKALVYFGAFKQHIGLYPPVRQPSLLAQVARYAGPKGNLQFPLSEPMPHALISQIVRARLQEVAATAHAPRAPKPRA